MPVNTQSIQWVFWGFEAKRGWMIRGHRGGRMEDVLRFEKDQIWISGPSLITLTRFQT